MDIKTPIDFDTLDRYFSHFSSYDILAERMGKKLILQKSCFCNVLVRSFGPENVLHIVDLSKCQVDIIKESVLKGTGSSVGIESLF